MAIKLISLAFCFRSCVRDKMKEGMWQCAHQTQNDMMFLWRHLSNSQDFCIPKSALGKREVARRANDEASFLIGPKVRRTDRKASGFSIWQGERMTRTHRSLLPPAFQMPLIQISTQIYFFGAIRHHARDFICNILRMDLCGTTIDIQEPVCYSW